KTRLIGIKTIFTIDKNRLLNETGKYAPASHTVSAGVTIGARSVVTEVAVTDKATLPLARYVITLEEVPPGQHPTKITPIAISLGKLNRKTRETAMIGIATNCATATTKILNGAFNTFLKSCVVSVSPIPNMIIMSNGLI